MSESEFGRPIEPDEYEKPDQVEPESDPVPDEALVTRDEALALLRTIHERRWIADHWDRGFQGAGWCSSELLHVRARMEAMFSD